MKFNLNINKGLAILVLVIVANTSFAQQDPMYTQYMFNTQTFNPAYTGTWESMGFMVLGRQQWVGWDGAPETYSFSFQSPLKNENIALGFNIINDKVGLEKRTSLNGDYSYRLKINSNTDLRLGLKAGFSNYSNNLREYDLFPGSENDPLFQGDIDNKFMPNFGVGAFLYSKYYYVGFSVPKLIQNDFENNYNNYTVGAEFRHYYFMAGLIMNLGESLKFKPTFLTKATVGAPVELDFTANFLLKEKLWLGAMYRTGDAYGFIAQWVFNRSLRIGYAIDFTTTNLQNYHSGTHEVMVSYEIKFLKEKFTSPRYF